MPDFEMLANRVGKNARHLGKWAKRERVTCWRVYDRDIPELPITVDIYEGALVVNDYRHGAPEERDLSHLLPRLEARELPLAVLRLLGDLHRPALHDRHRALLAAR